MRMKSTTPGSWATPGSINGWKKRCRPGDSRSQSAISTRIPLAAKIQATFASAIVRPVPPLNE